ncbi:MAG: OsmC family protein [Bacteroidetes bacterium]|nr:OsmC family protein [Bacteroidota bacterium]
MKRRASALWQGNGPEGKGTLNSTSGVLKETPYSVYTRFVSEDGKAGTNPEELIAAAHSACFTMALSFVLGGAGFTPVALNATATVTVDKVEDHFVIKSSHLDLVGEVPGISEEKFIELAGIAKATCPVSVALKAIEVTLTAKLK